MQERPGLLIFPYNGNGLEALACIGDQYTFIGFVDDIPEKQGLTHYSQRVFGREAFARYPDALVLAVPGSPESYQIRPDIIVGLNIKTERFAQLVHPRANVSPLAKLGYNVLIMAGVVITSNAEIGSHTCILPNTVIHHDVKVGQWCLIGANVTVAGSTVIEDTCYVGSGTSIKNGLTIGSRSLIGLGSNVVRNVQPNVRVAGNPAKELAKKA